MITVAMVGARRHYAVPRILNDAGLLDRFYTDVYVRDAGWARAVLRQLATVGRIPGAQRLLSRNEKSLPAEKVFSFPILGARYALARRRARNQQQLHQSYRNMAAGFARGISAHGFGCSSVVWGFNNAALELFESARQAGLRCVLEQTILPNALQVALLKEEIERHPGWALFPSAPATDVHNNERAQAEWQSADLITAGSNFVRDGLVTSGVPLEKIRVVPYGVDATCYLPGQRRTVGRDPLKVLFAGEIGLRKGVPDLLDALMLLGRARVRAKLVGTLALRPDKLAAYRDVAEVIGPLPRPRMKALYEWADVLVLPSIVEGSAAVTYEALLSGVPVVTTANAGSVVKDGRTGCVVPIRRPDVIAGKLLEYYEERDVLVRHSRNAVEDRYTASLTRYSEDLLRMVREEGLAGV